MASASSLLESALSVWEQLLGTHHYRVAETLLALGHLLSKYGDTREARSLAERALTTCQSTLGPDHIRAARARWILGGVLRNHGEPGTARPLYERAGSTIGVEPDGGRLRCVE